MDDLVFVIFLSSWIFEFYLLLRNFVYGKRIRKACLKKILPIYTKELVLQCVIFYFVELQKEWMRQKHDRCFYLYAFGRIY